MAHFAQPAARPGAGRRSPRRTVARPPRPQSPRLAGYFDRSQSLYRPDGLRALRKHLKPGGVFGLWSNDRPDAAVFPDVRAEPVSFHNPLQDSVFTQTIYLARTAGRDAA